MYAINSITYQSLHTEPFSRVHHSGQVLFFYIEPKAVIISWMCAMGFIFVGAPLVNLPPCWDVLFVGPPN